MGSLRISNLHSSVADFSLKDISVQIDEGEYFVLLGQSGSGKTRLLEAIAGVSQSSGKIFYNDEELSGKNPEARGIGFVYQDFALFPNLNVKENITFAGRYKTIENAKALFGDIVGFLELGPLLERSISDLSGGEKQRVALARALYARPKILLLDEPLSAIDPSFRNSIMKKLKEMHRHFGLTTIHVTHNFREASFLADKIAIIIDGRIEQVGLPHEVLSRPKSMQIATFLGFKNIFETAILPIKNETEFFSVDPNAIRIGKTEVQRCDFVFEGFVDECMEFIDHFKLYVDVSGRLFFVKIPKRDYTHCSAFDEKPSVTIGFYEKDISYL